ncbi:MAG: aminodeoxychorismate synthase component I [candidate division Zixibacteria bacterium]|nr:aminodeoxychorismate synthase component I [candidate division Zixibacteria bacterium]
MAISGNIKTVVSQSQIPAIDFRQIAFEPGAVWLDSSLCFADRGHSSFIAHQPVMDIYQQGQQVVVTRPDSHKTVRLDADIFEVLESYWADHSLFSVGYISYEACHGFLDLEEICPHDDIPSVRFLFYERVQQYRQPGNDSTSNDSIDYPDSRLTRIVPTLSRDEYCHRVSRIKEYIREGDIYQANFTTRFDIHSPADPFDVYELLRHLNPAPYSAYLNFGDYQVLSSSPERMFLKTDDSITSGPIKGTIARSDCPEDDARQLLASNKDRAELLMIVDLVRNDLGKIAQTGSVRVDEMFKPEVYSSVVHLVGDVAAKIHPKTRLTQILKALLPGGSITGAPKRRAVEIISQLESIPRSVYTGCIGYVHGNRADFNIAIRTMVHSRGVYHIHAGGGIVADSDPEAEYREMLLKADNLFRALNIERKEMACFKP